MQAPRRIDATTTPEDDTVNFAMDDDVLALVDSIAEFFERRSDSQAIAHASAAGATVDPARWAALCDLGLPTLRLAEPDGIGAGLLEATAVAEKIGAVLLPEPAVATIVLASAWTAHPEASELLGPLCSGSRVIALSGFDAASLSPSGAVRGRVRVPTDGGGQVALLAHDEYTNGSALVIMDMADLQNTTDRTNLDPTRPTALAELTDAEPVDVLRLTDASAELIRAEFAILTVSELVGGMQQVLADTVGFVKGRQQFGRPIGGFQAVKHRLADMYALAEQARALVQFAALECVHGTDSAASLIGAATRWVPRSAVNLFEDAIHLHGAMGYSWEVNVHLHLRRALTVRAALENVEFSAPQPTSLSGEAV
jgi:alkylation response protein AidB-like acyl-CoA dehydrogenase